MHSSYRIRRPAAQGPAGLILLLAIVLLLTLAAGAAIVFVFGPNIRHAQRIAPAGSGQAEIVAALAASHSVAPGVRA